MERPAAVEIHGAGQNQEHQPRAWEVIAPMKPKPCAPAGDSRQDRNGQGQADPEPAAVVGHHSGMVVSSVHRCGARRG